MKTKILLPLLLNCIFYACYSQKVSVQEDIDIITLSNSQVSFSFNKKNADITAIKNATTSLLGKDGRGYLLGPGFSLSPAIFKIVQQTDTLVELSFYHEASNHFQYDLHYVLRGGDAGAYCFLIQSHKAGDSSGFYGQTRWGLRADENLFDYHLVRDSIQGPMPKMASLKEAVQDWTFKLNDSTYYTKYDYADYIKDRHVHGMAGITSGLGLFVIQASHEYLNGGPTKQYQNVHANPFMICMFNCGHFLSDVRKSDDKITGKWRKLNGPFLIYVNEGKTVDAIWKDAKNKAAEEIDKWPYKWMDNADYPIQRGSVAGNIYFNNKQADEGITVVLAAPDYDWQAQSQGYIYTAQTGVKGLFTITGVRKGKYCLYAFGNNQTDEFCKANIEVNENTVTILGKLQWQPVSHGNIIWQLGVADRTTKGFKLSDHKRNYAVFTLPPANLTYTIGKSIENSDWYYAQTKTGFWNINFTLDDAYKDTATLTIAIAGAARKPLLQILVNGTIAGTINNLGNDASIYRSAIAGGYYQKKEIKFNTSLLKKGANTIALQLINAKPGAGIMYDAIKLEAFEK